MRTCSSVRRVALNIADLFEHAVDAAPGRPAVKAGDQVLTYAELEADANRLAHFLSSRGVQPGEHVALYARNGIEHVVGDDDVVIIKVSAQWWNQGMTNVAAARRVIERVLARPNFKGEIVVFENTNCPERPAAGSSSCCPRCRKREASPKSACW